MYETGGNKMVKLVGNPQAAPATETINPLEGASLGSERFLNPARLSEVVAEAVFTTLDGARFTRLETAPDAENGLGRGMGRDMADPHTKGGGFEAGNLRIFRALPATTEQSKSTDDTISSTRLIDSTGETSIHLN